MNKAISFIKYTFTLVGLLLLVFAGYSTITTIGFKQNALTATGTVVELARSQSNRSRRMRNRDSGWRINLSSRSKNAYSPIVEFNTANGQLIEFISSSASKNPSVAKGDTVEVIYSASNPQNARINSFAPLWMEALISGGLGVIFFGIGFSIIAYRFLGNKKREFLLANGIPVEAKVSQIGQFRNFEVNGRKPYQIHAEWVNPTNAELHVFKSENIWFDPSEFVASESVTVLIERNNPAKYWMDTTFLPKKS